MNNVRPEWSMNMPRSEARPLEQPAFASPYFSLTEAAAYARCSPRTIRRWIKGGSLDPCGHGGKVLVRREQLEELLAPKLNAKDAA